MPLISVIIPVYNCEKYISRAIESVHRQPLSFACEIIVVDDGSEDHSLEVCRSLMQEIQSLKVIHQDNQGVSAARNCGIRAASGEYVMFLDADDMYVDGILGEGLEDILKQKFDVIMFSAYTANIEKDRFGINMVLRDLVCTGKQPISIPGTFASGLYRRKYLLDKNILFDEEVRINEDQVFNLKAMYMAGKIRFCSRFCYIYIKNPYSASHKGDLGMEYMKAWKKGYDWFEENAVENKEAMLAFCRMKLYSRILLYAQNYSIRKPGKKALTEELKRIQAYDLLMTLSANQVLPHLKEMLELFQKNLSKFILLNWLEGQKVYWGRIALRITPVRRWRDKKVYPFEAVSLNGPVGHAQRK